MKDERSEGGVNVTDGIAKVMTKDSVTENKRKMLQDVKKKCGRKGESLSRFLHSFGLFLRFLIARPHQICYLIMSIFLALFMSLPPCVFCSFSIHNRNYFFFCAY